MQTTKLKLADGTIKGEWHCVKPGVKQKLIVICHGYQSTQKDTTLVTITKGLNDSGFDTVTFNFSPNVGGFDIEHQVGDIAEVLEYFKDYKEIILFAASFGALTSAIATIKLPRVNRLITLNGFFGEGELGPRYIKEYRKFRIASFVTPNYRRIWKYYKRELRPERIKVPVLVMYSLVDPDVFHIQSKKFFDGLKSQKKAVELLNSSHGVSDEADRKTVITEIVSWLSS